MQLKNSLRMFLKQELCTLNTWKLLPTNKRPVNTQEIKVSYKEY